MNGWTVEKLATLVNIVYGKSPAEIEKLDDGFPIFGTGGVVGYTSEVLCDGPSVILGRKGTIDKVQRCAGPFWAIDTTYYTTAKREFDWPWLYYTISSFDLRKLNEASGVPSLSRASLEALDVATPPLPEQQKIAAILTAVDDKLDVIARQVEATQTLKQGLMQTLFSRGVGTQDADGRWVPHSEFKDSELGEIPAGWNVAEIQSIAEVIRGASPRPQGDPRYYGGDVPRLMGADVTRDGKWVTPQIDFLTQEGAKRSRPCPKGTLTIICSGDVGIPSFLAVDACIHDGFLALINIDEASASKNYLYHVISSLKQRLDASATHGGIFTNLTTTILKEFRLPLPSIAEQEKIAAALDAVDDKLAVAAKRHQQFQTLKRGLMQKLLTGEWRVNVDASATGA
jgi:type I restriction enzyme S subunit